jgi:tyrosine-protein kinase Etk/Wzc
MEWITEYSGNKTLDELNERLIRLHFTLSDQLSYYRDSHPGNKDVADKIRETIRQIVYQYEYKITDTRTRREQLEQDVEENQRELQNIPGDQMQFAQYQLQEQVNQELYMMLTKKLQEARIAEAGVVEDVTVMSLAATPRGPSNQNMNSVAALGLMLGLVLGIMFAILREMIDTSIGTIEEIERMFKMSVLAAIPHFIPSETRVIADTAVRKPSESDAVSDLPPHRLIMQFDPRNPSAEAFRILRTNIEYLSFSKPLKTMLVTSSTMQEGKSTTCANLAVAFAQQGKKIMLLGCNLRRPSLYRLFGVEKKTGMTDILTGRSHWRECVHTVTDLLLGRLAVDEIFNAPGLDNFNFISFGERPPNPTELLASERMDLLLAELRHLYDIIIVDAPPILPVADSIVLAQKVDGVVLVYKAGVISKNVLFRAKDRLENVHARILGVVLNDIRP